MGVGISPTSRPLFTPGKDPVPIVQEAGWAPGPVWTSEKISSPPGFGPRLYSFLGPSALDGGGGSAPRPGRYLPPGKTRYPLYRRLGGPQGRSGRAENLVPNGIRSPDRPARSSVSIPTTLPDIFCVRTENVIAKTRSSVRMLCCLNFLISHVLYYQLYIQNVSEIFPTS